MFNIEEEMFIRKVYLLVISMILLITLGLTGNVQAQNNYKVFLNKNEMNFEETIFIENSRLYVPLRFISEGVGAQVTWNGAERSVDIQSLNGDKLTFYIDSQKVSINGNHYVMDVSPMIKDQRTYLPVRHASEFLHSVVLWDGDTNSAHIYSVPLHKVQNGETLSAIADEYGTSVKMLKERNGLVSDVVTEGSLLKVIVPETMEKTPDLDLLARLIHAEAKGEPFEGKVAVGSVVVNRVEDNRFPTSINGVILQENQFTPVKTGSIYEINPDEEAYEAAIEAVSGENNVGDAVFFFNPRKTSSPFLWSRTVIKDIGNHRFAK